MKEAVQKRNILSLWIEWYFIDAPKGIIRAWMNFLRFNMYFFSIPFLVRTLFSYWHKTRWHYGRGFSFWKYFEAAISNLFSRSIGAIVRIFLILLGLIIEVVLFFSGLFFLILWITIPFITIILFMIGVNLIF